MRKRTKVMRVGVYSIISLRHKVLRPGRPVESAHFEGDSHSWHYAVFSLSDAGMGDAICCATLKATTIESKAWWQLRGMATDPDYVGKGIGKELLHFAEDQASTFTGVRSFWCNARTEAVDFYLKQGWSVVGDQFDIPDVGPHMKMIKSLS